MATISWARSHGRDAATACRGADFLRQMCCGPTPSRAQVVYQAISCAPSLHGLAGGYCRRMRPGRYAHTSAFSEEGEADISRCQTPPQNGVTLTTSTATEGAQDSVRSSPPPVTQTAHISGLGPEGHGLAMVDVGGGHMCEVAVPGALPGETVSVILRRNRAPRSKGQQGRGRGRKGRDAAATTGAGTFVYKAELVAVRESPSAHRVEPRCALFGRCSGCQLQHLAYPQQLAWKQQSVEAALRRYVSGLGLLTPCVWFGWDYDRDGVLLSGCDLPAYLRTCLLACLLARPPACQSAGPPASVV